MYQRPLAKIAIITELSSLNIPFFMRFAKKFQQYRLRRNKISETITLSAVIDFKPT